MTFRDKSEEDAWVSFASAVLAGWWAGPLDELPKDANRWEEAGKDADAMLLELRNRQPTVGTSQPVTKSQANEIVENFYKDFQNPEE